MLGKLLVVKVSCLPTLGGSPRAGQGRKGRSLGMNYLAALGEGSGSMGRRQEREGGVRSGQPGVKSRSAIANL